MLPSECQKSQVLNMGWVGEWNSASQPHPTLSQHLVRGKAELRGSAKAHHSFRPLEFSAGPCVSHVGDMEPKSGTILPRNHSPGRRSLYNKVESPGEAQLGLGQEGLIPGNLEKNLFRAPPGTQRWDAQVVLDQSRELHSWKQVPVYFSVCCRLCKPAFYLGVRRAHP